AGPRRSQRRPRPSMAGHGARLEMTRAAVHRSRGKSAAGERRVPAPISAVLGAAIPVRGALQPLDHFSSFSLTTSHRWTVPAEPEAKVFPSRLNATEVKLRSSRPGPEAICFRVSMSYSLTHQPMPPESRPAIARALPSEASELGELLETSLMTPVIFF